MPTWTDVEIDYLPYGLGTETFIRSREGFSASGLRKSSPAVNSARREHFMQTLRRISEPLGSSTIPVFVRFKGERRRMDCGCVGHAVAAGLIEAPVDGVVGVVEQITLLGAPGAAAS